MAVHQYLVEIGIFTGLPIKLPVKRFYQFTSKKCFTGKSKLNYIFQILEVNWVEHIQLDNKRHCESWFLFWMVKKGFINRFVLKYVARDCYRLIWKSGISCVLFGVFYNIHDFANCSKLFYAKTNYFWMFLSIFTIYQVLPVKLFYQFLPYFTTGKVNFKNSDP